MMIYPLAGNLYFLCARYFIWYLRLGSRKILVRRGEWVTLHGTMGRETHMGVEVFGEGCFDYEFF